VLATADESSFRSVFEVNFFGPLALVRAFGPQLRARHGGVLFILSLAALVISRGSPIYSASKAAAMMFATGVSVLLAEGLAQPGFLLVTEIGADELGVRPSEGAADAVGNGVLTLRNSAEVPGVTSSRTLLMKSSLMPTSVIEPARALVAAPIAAPSNGTKKIRPTGAPRMRRRALPLRRAVWLARLQLLLVGWPADGRRRPTPRSVPASAVIRGWRAPGRLIPPLTG
jgi:NAD(P)-dependent dehydrogenase (short-subunit alcohol dehydrogenase family)